MKHILCVVALAGTTLFSVEQHKRYKSAFTPFVRRSFYELPNEMQLALLQNLTSKDFYSTRVDIKNPKTLMLFGMTSKSSLSLIRHESIFNAQTPTEKCLLYAHELIDYPGKHFLKVLDSLKKQESSEAKALTMQNLVRKLRYSKSCFHPIVKDAIKESRTDFFIASQNFLNLQFPTYSVQQFYWQNLSDLHTSLSIKAERIFLRRSNDFTSHFAEPRNELWLEELTELHKKTYDAFCIKLIINGDLTFA